MSSSVRCTRTGRGSSSSRPRTVRITSWCRESAISGASAARAASGSRPGNRGKHQPVSSEAAEKQPARESTDHVRKLVERAQQGERDALEELYLIHFDRIYSYLHMTVGNRHD